jgi:hypothetical protein
MDYHSVIAMTQTALMGPGQRSDRKERHARAGDRLKTKVTFPQDYPAALQPEAFAASCSDHSCLTLPLRFNLKVYKVRAAMSSTKSATFRVLATASETNQCKIQAKIGSTPATIKRRSGVSSEIGHSKENMRNFRKIGSIPF